MYISLFIYLLNINEGWEQNGLVAKGKGCAAKIEPIQPNSLGWIGF